MVLVHSDFLSSTFKNQTQMYMSSKNILAQSEERSLPLQSTSIFTISHGDLNFLI